MNTEKPFVVDTDSSQTICFTFGREDLSLRSQIKVHDLPNSIIRMTFRNTILPAPGQPAKDAISKPMNKRSSLYAFPKKKIPSYPASPRCHPDFFPKPCPSATNLAERKAATRRQNNLAEPTTLPPPSPDIHFVFFLRRLLL